MDGKKAVWCFVLFVLVISVTACSRRTPEQVGKTDISDKEDGNAVTVSENIPDALEQIPDEYKRSEERRVGKEWSEPSRSRWWAVN